MKNNGNRFPALSLAVMAMLATFNLQPSTCHAQGTAFTYQGRLNDGANPANGIYDLRFTIYDSTNIPGTLIAGPLTNAAMTVSNGLFTVTLDFGPGVFTGANRWLDLAVRTNGGATFVPLTPRQQVAATPYAVTAGNLTGTVPASQVSGVVPLAQLPSAVMTNNATGVTLSGNLYGNFGGSFYGNGSGLTVLNPANLSPGTAAINISGTAATATIAVSATNLIGNVAEAQIPANLARLNGTNVFTGTNNFANVVIATNVNNLIAGAFTGDGGGLTNLNTAQFANSVLTNGETGLTLGGTFSGSLSGNATTATTAKNFSGSLSGDVTGTQSATVVASVGGQSAVNIASGASAANAANNDAIANTIVKRDAGGSFTNNNITLNGNLNLPATSSGTGIIYFGGVPTIQSVGGENIFAGWRAGNLTMTGANNAGLGDTALNNNTSGNGNTAVGSGTLAANDSGSYNTAVGGTALFKNSGSFNTALGYNAGHYLTTGSSNIDIGNIGTGTDNNLIRIGDQQAQTFIAGLINGNGGGLTNLNAAQLTGTLPLARLPAAVVTNNETGVNISGTFSGNGAGVTNVSLGNVNSSGIILWPGNFAFASSAVTLGYPSRVIAADLNGDGKPDLVTVNPGIANALIILTNNGLGIFGSNAAPAVGNYPYSVAAADVNGDGKMDLISANLNAGTLTVLTNNGNGVFGFSATLSIGSSSAPACVITADVNGDGKLDLISANNGVNTLTMFTNNGSGVFGSNATLTVDAGPSFVTTADVNGDGKPDLISVNSTAGTLTVLTNNGSGVFGFNATLNGGSNPRWLAAADINGDGRPDFIVANNNTNTLVILTNNGSGVFGSNATLNVSSGAACVVAADINGDGKLDLIIGNNSDNTLTVLTNNGSGTFGLCAALAVAGSPQSVVAVDVNGDGRLDLVSANFTSPGTLSVFFNMPTYLGNFSGNGSGLNNLNANNLTSGTVPLAQLPGAVLTNGQTGPVTLNGTLVLPAAPDTIYSGSSILLRADNSENFLAGVGAGNLTMSGAGNTVVGYQALLNNTNGNYNTADGVWALYYNTSGSCNAAEGYQALFNNAAGTYNTANGFEALYSNTNGSFNNVVGYGALWLNRNGNNNIALGNQAGYNIVSNYNIDIGNQGSGTDNGIIRLGTPGIHTNTFIAGVINGNGAGLTNLSASQISSGTLSVAQLPGAVLTNNNTGYVTLMNNVGIGTGPWSPYPALAVQSPGGWDEVWWQTPGPYQIGRLGGNTNTGGSISLVSWNSGYGTVGVFLQGNGSNYITGGNVGIGKTSPATALDVNGVVTATSFTGDGAGLTGLTVSQMPSSVVTNNESGVTLNSLNLLGVTTISSNVVMNDKDIQLRNTYDHGLGWYGSTKTFSGAAPDGPVLYGYGGGALGIFRTGSQTNVVLTWNSATNVGIGNLNPTNRLMVVNARCDGSSWINSSDRNLKQDFSAVNPQTVLEKVSALPVQTWSYKAQPGEKHLGPVAQDFHAAFGLGADDVSIATVDESGVALAAIQGLNQKLEEQAKEKDVEIRELKQSVAELKALVQKLAGN